MLRMRAFKPRETEQAHACRMEAAADAKAAADNASGQAEKGAKV